MSFNPVLKKCIDSLVPMSPGADSISAEHDYSDFQSVQAAAVEFLNHQMGPFYPLPLKKGAKMPVDTNWPNLRLVDGDIHEFFERDSNLGVILGSASKGLVDVDLDSPEALKVAEYLLPNTRMVHGRPSAPKSHYWYQCQGECKTVKFQVSQQMVVEIRGDGAQTMVPPSIHPDTSERLQWIHPSYAPTEIAYEVLRTHVADVAVAALLLKVWSKGIRHQLALAFSGACAQGGVEKARAERILEAVCKACGDSERADRISAVRATYKKFEAAAPVTGIPTLASMLTQNEAQKLVEWLGGRAIPKNLSLGPAVEDCTDLGNARRFAEKYSGTLVYTGRDWEWMRWTGKKWKRLQPAQVKALAIAVIDDMRNSSAATGNTKFQEWAQRSGSADRVKSMITLAEAEVTLQASAKDFDNNPYLVNTNNGTLDLQTGELRDHNPADRLTKIVNCDYNAAETCPIWEKALHVMMNGDSELMSYLQKCAGYTLLGANPQQLFFILYGSGANGKSVFINTIKHILGRDYASQMNSTTLLNLKRGESARADLASLQGVRLAVASEIGEADILDEPLLKQVTGNDDIRCRYLYKDEFEYTPQFTIFLCSNHLPHVKGQDHGIWRRIRVIPFKVTIPEHEQDHSLQEKLKDESAGILAWLVKGYLEYMREGLDAPSSVKEATQNYRTDMDTLGAFVEQCCEAKPGATVGASELYQQYMQWCESCGFHNLNQLNFKRRMQARGFAQKRNSSGYRWQGLDLRCDLSLMDEEGNP